MKSDDILENLTLGEFRAFLLRVVRDECSIRSFSRLPVIGKSFNEQRFRSFVGIIDAMTEEERHNPTLIDSSRRRRIGAGAGTASEEVTFLLSLYVGIVNSRKKA